MNKSMLLVSCTAYLLLFGTVSASELIYTPVNPSFGGNPLNGSHLLNKANAQNDFTDPNATEREEQSAIDEFNESLQRSILSRITSALSASIVGDDGKIKPGQFETTDFVITVEDLGGDQVRITTTDKLTGDETVFEINTAL